MTQVNPQQNLRTNTLPQNHLTQDSSSQKSTDPAVGRRQFCLGLGAAAAALSSSVAHAREFGDGAAPVRYPDPDIVSLDKRFDKYKLGNTPIQRLHTGTLWAEGPAWNGVGRYLLWSDIPNNVQLRWLEEDGHVSIFRHPSGNSNGNTFDYQGRQIACEHGNRRVVRYEPNGKVTVVADKFQGKPFNAPNDAVVHPDDGAIWFTDPGYGSLMNYEGHKSDLLLKEAVYRIDANTGRMMTDDEMMMARREQSSWYRELSTSEQATAREYKARQKRRGLVIDEVPDADLKMMQDDIFGQLMEGEYLGFPYAATLSMEEEKLRSLARRRDVSVERADKNLDALDDALNRDPDLVMAAAQEILEDVQPGILSAVPTLSRRQVWMQEFVQELGDSKVFPNRLVRLFSEKVPQGIIF